MFMFVSDATLLTDLLPVFQDNAENAEARDSDRKRKRENRLLRKISWILLVSKFFGIFRLLKISALFKNLFQTTFFLLVFLACGHKTINNP